MRVRSMNAFVAPTYRRGRQNNHHNNVHFESETLPQSTDEIVRQSGLHNDIKKIISSFGKDDYILIGLIAVLIFEGCDDYVLLAALGYLFIVGII